MEVFFLIVGSRQKKTEFTEYHGIFIPFKSRVFSKYGSPIFPLFGSQGLVLYLHILVKAKFFSHNSNLTNLVDVNVCMKTIKELNAFLKGFILCLKNAFAVPHYLIKMFQLQLRHLIFSKVQQFLSRLP